MSDQVANSFAKDENGNVPQEKCLTLSITLFPDNRIEFNLPTNKVLAYGLLGAAHEQLMKLSLMQEMQQAPLARGGLDGLLKRINGGRH